MKAKKRYDEGGKVGDPIKSAVAGAAGAAAGAASAAKPKAKKKFSKKKEPIKRFTKTIEPKKNSNSMLDADKMPMYMYGGKVYAESGAMIKAMLKDPKQAEMARKVLGMD